MKFHLTSDIHLDVNGYHEDVWDDFLLPDCYNLIAGDIAGYPEVRTKFIKDQISKGRKGAFIEGNHVIYNNCKLSYQDQLSKIAEKFEYTPIHFLADDCVRIDEENIVIWGGTLWTDYMLDGPADVNGFFAEQSMNDFRFRCWERKGKPYLCKGVWQDFAQLHKDAMCALESALEEYPDHKFVVLTHHAPSGHSIPVARRKSNVCSAYASNLENFILDHPQIKLWCHGHIHSACDYMIGDCRVVCNPYGYCTYGETSHYNYDLILEV